MFLVSRQNIYIVVEGFCQTKNPDKINFLFYEDILRILCYEYGTKAASPNRSIRDGIDLESARSIQKLPKEAIQKDRILRRKKLFWQYIWSDYIYPKWMDDEFCSLYDWEWWNGLRQIIAEEKKACGYDV